MVLRVARAQIRKIKIIVIVIVIAIVIVIVIVIVIILIAIIIVIMPMSVGLDKYRAACKFLRSPQPGPSLLELERCSEFRV